MEEKQIETKYAWNIFMTESLFQTPKHLAERHQ